jgi:hypothetical protein
MILFVDVCSSCTAEDSVELVEVLDFAVVVLSVPVSAEKAPPVGIALLRVDRRTPAFVYPSNGVGILLILVDVLENALGVELADGIDTIGETNLNVNELLHDS